MSPEENDADDMGTLGSPGAATSFDVMNMSLKEFVVRNDTSVRLRHAMLNFEGSSEIHTIGDFYDAGQVADAILMRDLRNFGRKTADELRTLIGAVVPTWDPVTGRFLGEPEPAVEKRDRAERELSQAFGVATLGEVLASTFLSTKLSRVLCETGLEGQSFVSIVVGMTEAQAKLKSLRGVGRFAAEELDRVCSQHVAERLEGNAVHRRDGYATPNEPVVAARSLVEIIDHAMSFLTPREVEVIERRYGFRREEAETLEEVGGSFVVTRERIRQIEAKAVKRLRRKTSELELTAALSDQHGAVWDVVGSSFILFDALHVHRRSLDPAVLLALTLLDRGIEDWLDATSLRTERGWYRDRDAREKLFATAERLRAMADSRPMPRSVDAAGDDLRLCEAAAKLVLGLHVEAGYLVLRRPGARLSRAIHLHALLSRASRSQTLVRLLADYRSSRPADPCGERDAAIVIEAAPHLFLDLTDDRWVALGAGGTLAAGVGGGGAASSEVDASQETTVHATIADVLRRLGPSRFVDLRDEVAASLPANRSANSVAPMLIGRRDTFVKILQGIYALADQVPDDAAVLHGEVPYLLNDGQARLFAMARYAGEPWGGFPLWTPAAESRLCRWARSSAPVSTYESLLAVASIDEWPVAEDERAEWHRLARRDGRYLLQTPLTAVAKRMPDLDRVLACCIRARETGSLNWMVCNRIDKGRLTAGSGIALVAILVAAGGLLVPDGDDWPWLRSHRAGPGLDTLIDDLARELHDTGALPWEGSAGTRLRSAISERLSGVVGWIEPAWMASMMKGSRDTSLEEGADRDDADVVFAQSRRRLEAKRREETLQWLLAG